MVMLQKSNKYVGSIWFLTKAGSVCNQKKAVSIVSQYEINLVKYHCAKDRYWHLTLFLNEKLVTYIRW